MIPTSVVPYRVNPTASLATLALKTPDLLIERIAGPPVEMDGNRLDRSVQLLMCLESTMPGGAMGSRSASVKARRRDHELSMRLTARRLRGVEVKDLEIPGPAAPMPIRTYRPAGASAAPPALVYFHGGGWVFGSLDSQDALCRALARSSGCVVVSIGYRLAPEHPYPAAVVDAVAGYEWVATHSEELGTRADAVGVVGESAGGTLAAVVARRAGGAGVRPPAAQGLIYPATNMHFTTRSIDEFAEGFMLTKADMEWFRGHYLPSADHRDEPDASPLLADDLSGLPAAAVWTAGFDPLRDEGDAYADRLRDAGVEVFHSCCRDQVHGFASMGIVPGGMERIAAIGRTLGQLVRGREPS